MIGFYDTRVHVNKMDYSGTVCELKLGSPIAVVSNKLNRLPNRFRNCLLKFFRQPL